MKVDNSALTGEADPLLRVVECTHPDNPLETKNLAFFGTLCKEGSGKGMVVNIGDNTVMGQIADLAIGGEAPDSPLNRELKRFVIMISVIAVTMGVALFFLSVFVQKASINLAVSQAIGIIVANVPEGILGCITISLSITAKILYDKQVLVKNLEAVETLGSTSCICSDKTGTLTQNKMTVENLWYDAMKRHAHNREKHGKSVEYEYDLNDPTFRDLHDCAIITSEARFNIQNKDKSGVKWLETPTIGDASESALIKFF
jgi:sodium/potassium-transporting ATPase subunit alpha